MSGFYCTILSADIQGTSATKGDGLCESLSWLQTHLITRRLKKGASKPANEVKESLTGKEGAYSGWFSSLTNYFTCYNTSDS